MLSMRGAMQPVQLHGIDPALLQRLSVTPNELVAERPFIAHNIRMTRQAYGLDRIETL